MSDAPPDRKDAGDSPEAPKNPWVRYLVWAIFVPVLYVFSIGPVFYLVERGPLPFGLKILYEPLGYLPEPALNWILCYIDWWTH